MPMTFESWFAARHPQIPIAGATAVLRLAEGGATVPFIARYRKEQTGALDEVAIRAVIDGKESWRVDGPVSDCEQFILVSTECNGYREGDTAAPELKAAMLPDAFIVDYVRVFDEVPA